MAQRLTERLSLWLQLLAGRHILFPGRREVLRVIADFRPPGFAVGEQYAEDREWRSDPFGSIIGDCLCCLVITTLGLADFLRHVADISDAVAIELRPVVDRHDDVGSGARLDRRGNARLDAVALDCFDIELDPERFLALLGDLSSEELI